MPKNEKLFVRVTESMLHDLDAIVEQSPGDRSDHMRQALQEYIARRQREQSFYSRYSTDHPLTDLDLVPSYEDDSDN